MKAKVLLGFVLLAAPLLCAQQKITPLNVKLGLWDSTWTSSSKGQLPLPQEMLDRMTPEQRAKFEAAVQAQAAKGAIPQSSKYCLTREKLNEHVFRDNDPDCTQTVVTSTSSKLDVKLHCTKGKGISDGSFQIEALDSGSVKGKLHMTITGDGGRSMDIDGNFSGKWLGPACGDVK